MIDFTTVLDDCVARLRGGESVEQILQAYPHEALRLEPLLRVAQQVQQQPRYTLSEAAFERGRQRLHRQAMSRHRRRARSGRGLLDFLFPRSMQTPVWARAAITALLILMLSVSALGIVTQTAAAQPGTPLYGLKLGAENGRLRLASDPLERAALRIQYSAERAGELSHLTGAQFAPERIALAMLEQDRAALDDIGRARTAGQSVTAHLVQFNNRVSENQTLVKQLIKDNLLTDPGNTLVNSYAAIEAHFQTLVEKPAEPTATLTPVPTDTPTPAPSATPTAPEIVGSGFTITETATTEPSATPTAKPSLTPSRTVTPPTPSRTPAPSRTATPSVRPPTATDSPVQRSTPVPPPTQPPAPTQPPQATPGGSDGKPTPVVPKFTPTRQVGVSRIGNGVGAPPQIRGSWLPTPELRGGTKLHPKSQAKPDKDHDRAEKHVKPRD